MLRMRREYDKRVDQCEDRIAQLQTDMQKEIDKHDEQLRKVTKERDDAQE
jgi:galactokinase